MSQILFGAGVYNLIWGAAVILFPGPTMEFIGLDHDPIRGMLWGCIGMIVGVYGIGYIAAAPDPVRHWPIVLVGLLGKILGPMGFVIGLIQGVAPPRMGLTILTNDLIWWLPFGAILWLAFRRGQGRDAPIVPLSEEQRAGRLGAAITSDAHSIDELSRNGHGVLLVGLRHLGCTYCRQMVDDLVKQRDAINAAKLTPVLLHQSEETTATRASFEKLGAVDFARVSDPDRDLYRALNAPRGTFKQLFGFKVFAALPGAVKFGTGRLQGDGLQMPGAWVIRDGKVVATQTFDHAGARIDLPKLIADAGAASAATSNASEAEPADSGEANADHATSESNADPTDPAPVASSEVAAS